MKPDLRQLVQGVVWPKETDPKGDLEAWSISCPLWVGDEVLTLPCVL